MAKMEVPGGHMVGIIPAEMPKAEKAKAEKPKPAQSK